MESRFEPHTVDMEYLPEPSISSNGPTAREVDASVMPKTTENSIPFSNTATTEKPSGASSQASMASSSSAQKPFPQLQVSSSDISQFTMGEILDRDMTPPSSSSAFSTQEQSSQPVQYSSLKPYRPVTDDNMSDDFETRTESTPAEGDVPMERRESSQSSKSGSSVELAPGQKRTASGAVKSNHAAVGNSPGKPTDATHTRTSSSESSGSKMAEVEH
jgi:hypothetical protein